MLLEGVIIEHNWQCCIGLVYDYCDVAKRLFMFNELTAAIHLLNVPTLILGDFNDLLRVKERRGQ